MFIVLNAVYKNSFCRVRVLGYTLTNNIYTLWYAIIKEGTVHTLLFIVS